MRWIDRQVDRAFRRRADGRVIFGPSWGAAHVIPSPESEQELRDGMRGFTIACWMFALGCPVLGLAGRFMQGWLWSATGSLAVLKATAIGRLVITLVYFAAGAGWIWWSLRRLTDGLEPTPPSWTSSSRLQRAALRSTDNRLALRAGAGALVAIASVVVLISFRSMQWRSATAVASVGVLGLGLYLWFRVLMGVRHAGLPNKAAPGDGHHGDIP